MQAGPSTIGRALRERPMTAAVLLLFLLSIVLALVLPES